MLRSRNFVSYFLVHVALDVALGGHVVLDKAEVVSRNFVSYFWFHVALDVALGGHVVLDKAEVVSYSIRRDSKDEWTVSFCTWAKGQKPDDTGTIDPCVEGRRTKMENKKPFWLYYWVKIKIIRVGSYKDQSRPVFKLVLLFLTQRGGD
jgi:hypothetical protein